jgi:ABC-type multidrug transport system fused ATPase/permease subunit
MTRTWSIKRSPSKRGGAHEPLLPGSRSAPAEDVEQGLAEAPQTASVWRLLREARPEAWALMVATVFLLIGSLANLAVPKTAGGGCLSPPYCSACTHHARTQRCCSVSTDRVVTVCAHAGGLIDACTQAASGVLTPSDAQAVLNQQLVYLITILLVGGVASGLRAYMFNAAAERVMCRLRVQLFSKVCGQQLTAARTAAVQGAAQYDQAAWERGRDGHGDRGQLLQQMHGTSHCSTATCTDALALHCCSCCGTCCWCCA